MSLPARAEIDPEYRFDLTRLYDDPAAWHRAAGAFRERVADLETTASRDPASPDALRELLDATAACHRERASLQLYAALYGYVHTDEDAATDLRRANRDLDAAFDPAVAAACRRLASLDDERFDALADAVDDERFDTLADAVDDERFDTLADAVDDERFDTLADAVDDERFDTLADAVDDERFDTLADAVDDERFDTLADAVDDEQFDALADAVDDERFDTLADAVDDEQFDALADAVDDERFDTLADAVDAERRTDTDGTEPNDTTASIPTDYRPYAESLRRRGRHTPESAVEETMATVDEPLGGAKRTIRAVTTEDLDPGIVERPDGTDVELRIGNVQTELRNPDRDYRRRVYETIRSELDRFEHTLTRAVGEKLKAARATATVRGYDSHREHSLAAASYPPTGIRSRLPESVHDTLVETVVAERDPYDRARRLRRDRLGVDTLRPWDTRVPLVDADPTVSYETATDHILAALEPLGDDYVARVRRLLDERRVDAFPTANKRTDIPAVCPAAPDDGPYVLANFRENVRTTFFLAHELGHALNVSYHTDGPTRYACNRVPVSEVPSLVHELLLADHLTETEGSLADAARERRVELLGGNLYRNARSTAFGHRLAEIVADGTELTPERAREANRRAAARFDPVVEPPVDRDGRDWLGGGLRDAYAGHQYVLGVLGATAAVEGLADGDLSPADYRAFLRHTGHDDALAAFDRLGVDPTAASAYRRAATVFGRAVDDLERATAE
ncbi:M3 family metallopeptidase [Halobaculum sp. MBLA0143]|uniref:M3 family metallopeptidase n=1 Tax=Halobaculum sp. MBLA0143 TaxID=3079933 RepID=UPI003526086B